MDRLHYEEMATNFNKLIKERLIQDKKVFLFGHCNATEDLVELMLNRGITVTAILDNNKEKQGKSYRGISIKEPSEILKENEADVIVCIVARAYAAMAAQLDYLGYKGIICRLANYNSYAEYSLSRDTISRMNNRRRHGSVLFAQLKKKYPNTFFLFCPFSALGDIYIMMSYLPYYLKTRDIERCVVCVIGNACAQVVRLFGDYLVDTFSQENLDEIIQAALYERAKNIFIPHQDRPYVVKLYKALYDRKISLEQMYCCGVFGLPKDTQPFEASVFSEYAKLEMIREGRAVIFSPYAKSITTFADSFWDKVVTYWLDQGYQCFTNVAGDEKPLRGTFAISPKISEIKSVVERAGTFVGIRSGLCDVIRKASARKIAFYPDYNYSDTKWKAIDVYALEGWGNIEIMEECDWGKITQYIDMEGERV